MRNSNSLITKKIYNSTHQFFTGQWLQQVEEYYAIFNIFKQIGDFSWRYMLDNTKNI